MRKHEFYADPTVFDQWQNDAGTWFCSRLEKASPFAWAMGFSTLAVAFLLIATAVLIESLRYKGSVDSLADWNQLLAQQVTFVIAVAASMGLFKQAIAAWPEQLALSDGRGDAALAMSCNEPQPAGWSSISKSSEAALVFAGERQAVQAFFTGVRAAGVNVAIAKALFAAGVRSVDHLRQIEDSDLRSIHGVGSATVHRLRAHFTQR